MSMAPQQQQSMMQQQPMMPQPMNIQMPTMQQAQQGINLMNQINTMGQNQAQLNNSNPLDFFK
jgi:hypothetical protein